ncbi:MAG: N-acetylneuraminate synthase family protein [Proteobacteria bacterium]|nr:N-acetylneuraminate synthase family protein [Pseudomonadota bacterium]
MNTIEIIAEIGQNHNGDMALAEKMIHDVKKAGADVAKFQLYDAKKLFPKENNPWYEYNLATELSKDDLNRLVECCDKAKIEFMASVFDEERIAWLEEAQVKRYKIASRSIFDNQLIDSLIKTKKPIIASLGFWKENQFPVINASKIDYLYCISKYPTEFEDLKLSAVDFSRYSGFSDHTIGVHATQIAIARGARIIEKHFTLDKSMYGPDHLCSMDSNDLKKICQFRDDVLKCL